MYDEYDVYWVVTHLFSMIINASSEKQPDMVEQRSMYDKYTWNDIDLGNGVIVSEFVNGKDGFEYWNHAKLTIAGHSYELSYEWMENPGEFDPSKADCDDGLIDAAVSIWPKILCRKYWGWDR